MKRIKNYLILGILATTLFFGAICSLAQTPKVEITERLPDGSVLLTIDGVKYRALTADQIRQMQATKIEAASCAEEKATLGEQKLKLQFQVVELTANVAGAEKMIAKERERGDQFKSMWEDEVKLRLSVTVPPKKPGVVERVLNNPITKVVLAAASIWVAAAKK